MNKFWIVTKHTFLTKVRTRTFIIMTLLIVGLILLMSNLSNIINYFDQNNNDRKIAVVDQTEGNFANDLKETLKSTDSDLVISSMDTVEEAEVAIKDKKMDSYLLIEDENNQLACTFKTKNISNNNQTRELQNAMQQLNTAYMAQQLSISSTQLNQLFAPVQFDKIAYDKDAKTEEELTASRGLVYVLLIVIYMMVLMYANMIAMEVATEKTTRVMEILVSSVPPIQQLFAKILGVLMVSIVQLVVIGTIGYYNVKKNLSGTTGGFTEYFGFQNVPVSTFIYAAVFMILGYLLYSTLAALLGSVVSRVEDVQQMITPMTMTVVISFFIAMFGINAPEAPFIKGASFFPFFTPVVMFLRVGMTSVPTWQVVLGIAILLGTIILLSVIAARVYKGGVLMYGKSSSFKDILKAWKLTKNEK